MSKKALSDVERLLIAQAIYQKLGGVVATKGDGLRVDVDKAYRDLWEQTGAKSFAMRMGGEKVATYSISETRDKTKTVYDCEDWKEFEDWCVSEEGFYTLMDYAMEDTQKFIEYAVKSNEGAVPPGITPHTETVKGGAYKNGRMSDLDSDRILEIACGDKELPSSIAGLLKE